MLAAALLAVGWMVVTNLKGPYGRWGKGPDGRRERVFVRVCARRAEKVEA